MMLDSIKNAVNDDVRFSNVVKVEELEGVILECHGVAYKIVSSAYVYQKGEFPSAFRLARIIPEKK